ncbi:MAG: winged helix-turn-helix domain-containing protein [Chloroflexota bacterium]
MSTPTRPSMNEVNPSSQQPEVNHPWVNHKPTYRAREVQILADWIRTGANGSVIGPSGTGKSDLLGFLCHRPEVLQGYLPSGSQPVTLLPMDLNTLPAPTLSALYRVILRAFDEHHHRFAPESQKMISQTYEENSGQRDPFLSQTGVRKLLRHLQEQRHRVVFALDRFDAFSTMLSPQMGDSLRGLRDGFKETLSYITCMTHSPSYLPNPEVLGDLKRLLDQQVCILGPMSEQDTRQGIARRVNSAETKPTTAEVATLVELTGGYPSLVTQVCRWWLTTKNKPSLEAWQEALMQQINVRHRLEDIWFGLTQEEQLVLTEMHGAFSMGESNQEEVAERYRPTVAGLLEKGLLSHTDPGYRLFGTLFASHIATIEEASRGRISLEHASQTLYQGAEIIQDLTAKERSILQFLAEEPYVQHTYTDIIVAAWTDEERYHGVTNDSLFQVIRTLRRKIEPTPSKPVYVVNWRGKPEGGYQFFPEGRPR